MFTDTATLKAAVRDPSCCDNGENDEGGNDIRPASYNNSCTYNGVHIKDWDVSQITDFDRIFTEEHMCFMYFNADISKWDVSSGLSFVRMFSFAYSFNQDISGWRPKVNLPAKKFYQMFFYAISFNQNLDDWGLDVTPSEYGLDATSSMFDGTYSLSKFPTWFTKSKFPNYPGVANCANSENCGTCDQPRLPEFRQQYIWLFPNVAQTVTCNAGRLANYEGVSCRDQNCGHNSLCHKTPCSTHRRI